MDDTEEYSDALLANMASVTDTVAGAGSAKANQVATHLMQEKLISFADNQAMQDRGGVPLATAVGTMFNVVYSKLMNEPNKQRNYEKLLKVFRSKKFGFLADKLEKSRLEAKGQSIEQPTNPTTTTVSPPDDTLKSASVTNFGDRVETVVPASETVEITTSIDVRGEIAKKGNAKGLAVIVTNAAYQKSSGQRPLQFTEKDGNAMLETFQEFNFNCYMVKNLTGDLIQELVDQMSKCEYTNSYKYIAFVYTGHGDIKTTGDEKSSVLIGIDGKKIETNYVINRMKSIKPQSMVKMLFLDSCRGGQIPPPVIKGVLTNCLVAYATQLGQVSIGNTEGSQWMIPLAAKLKQKEKSVQEVLKMVKEDMLNKSWPQYPETDDSDCDQPIYLAREPMESKGGEATIILPKAGEKPNIGQLASYARRDGKGLVRIIDRLLEADMKVIQSLNKSLLSAKDRPDQRGSGDEYKLGFVLEILTKWLSLKNPKVNPTWENLTDCLEDTGIAVEDIKENLDYN